MLNTVLCLTGLLLVAVGAEPLYHAVTNRRPVAVTCESFAQAPPRALWLRIAGCEVDYLGAGYREWGGRIAELYFPARPAGWAPTEPAPLVATTRDPSVLALAESTMGEGRTPDQEQFLVMMLKIVTALRAAREIDGYAKASLLGRLTARTAVKALSTPVSADVVVLELHAGPRLLMPGAAVTTGVVLLGLVVFMRHKRRLHAVAPADAEERLAGNRQTDDAAASPAAQRLHLMLLNLPAEADPGAIEAAPPLGDRREVIAAMARAIPGLAFDASGTASISENDFALTLDAGRTTPVYTVIVDARGAGALPVVRRILDRTGWRAFAPRTGSFL